MLALQQYGSGSDSGSGSAHSSGDEGGPAAKRRRSRSPPPPALRAALPAPAALLQSFGEAAEEEDPHQGRVRAFELPEGFFPVHVFVPLTPEGGVAAALAAFVAAACGAAPRGDLRLCAPVATAGGTAPMHLSLSRTLPVCRAKLGSLTVRCMHMLSSTVPTQLASSVQDALRAALKRAPPPAWLPLRAPCALVNDGRTRTFLCVEATEAFAPQQHAAFRAAVAAVDAAFARHDLPPFYAPPRAHASLAWALGDAAQVAYAAAAAAAAAGAPPPDWRAALPRVEMLVGTRVVPLWPPETTKHAGKRPTT